MKKIKAVAFLICVLMVAYALPASGSVEGKKVGKTMDAPTWGIGDSWTYDGALDINYQETPSQIVLNAEIDGLCFTVADDSNGFYKLNFDGDMSVEGSVEIDEPPISISVELKRATLEGSIYLEKSDLAMEKVYMNISGLLKSSIEPVPIPFNGGILMMFDPPYITIEFPINVGDEWETSDTQFYINISSGLMDFFENIIKLLEKVVPDEMSQILEDILQYIEEAFPAEFPIGGTHVECKSKDNITVEAGEYEAFKISLTQLTFLQSLDMYYAPAVANIIKFQSEEGGIFYFSLGMKSTTYTQVGAPDKPDKPSGKRLGRIGKEYVYETTSTDPDGDRIRYGWDWDGDKVVDEWTDYHDSGEKVEVSHVWDNKGRYKIFVKAEDETGLESEWSDSLSVTMPELYQDQLGMVLDMLNEWFKSTFGRELIPSFPNRYT